MTEKAVIRHLVNGEGLSLSGAKKLISGHQCGIAYGVDVAPREESVFRVNGLPYMNLWVKPTLKPEPAPYPLLDSVLDVLTNNDPAGKAWLTDWIAYKVQNPAVSPLVAVVFHNTPGSGKGTLFGAIQLMLGKENTAIIERKALENKFNSRWIGKLAVLGDELVSLDDLKDLSDSLKVLIGGPEVELEGKGTNQAARKNRLAWMFASNHRITPVRVEAGDRRFTVFSNHSPLPPGYSERLINSYSPHKEPLPSLLKEIAGFYHDLLQRPVDEVKVNRPYENDARKYLIQASVESYDAFRDFLLDAGFDFLQKRYGDELGLVDNWDFKEKGVAAEAVWSVYKEFCRKHGFYPVRAQRLYSSLPWKVEKKPGLKVQTMEVPR